MVKHERGAQDKDKMRDLFLQEMPAKVLILLKKRSLNKSVRDSYASQISKDVDCTYSHTVKLLSEMDKLGLVKFERKGRLKLVILTTRGFDLANRLDTLVRNLNKF